MRSQTTTTFLVPPYNAHCYPHEAFPPWQSLRPVFDLLSGVLRRSPTLAPLRHLEIPLFQAARYIAAVAGGDLPPAQWFRRARVAVEKLDRVKRATRIYVAAKTLTAEEAQKIAELVDATMASLADEVARVPLPEEIRMRLPELSPPTIAESAP